MSGSRKATPKGLRRSCPEVRRGRRAGHVRKGCPGTWEACRLHANEGARRSPNTNLQAPRRQRPTAATEQTMGRGVVSRSEGNQSERDGRQESERLKVPVKPGNRPYGTR